MNTHELAVLYQTAIDLAGKHDLTELLEAVLARAEMLVGAKGGAIGLYDAIYDEIELTVQSQNMLPDHFRRRRRGQGMVGHVIETRAPLLITNYRQSPFFDDSQGDAPGIGSALNIPLLYSDELLGVLSLYETAGSDHIFAEDDVHKVTALASLAASAIQNTRLRWQAERRAELDRIVAGIATRFIHIRSEHVDGEINETLRMIGEFAGVDRSYLFRFSADCASMSNTHEWCAPGIEPQIEFLQNMPSDSMPWTVQRFQSGFVVHVRSLDELPVEARVEREVLEAQDIRSVVLIPMRYGAQTLGFIGFDAVRQERSWSDHDISLLKLVAEVFTLALDRGRTERELQQRQREFETLAEHTPDILARVDPNGAGLYLNSAGRQLESLRQAEISSRLAPAEAFFYRDDAIEEAIATRHPVAYERQITLPDGMHRWYHVQLVPEFDDEGQIESILSVSRDITVLKEAQAELRRFNQTLERRVAERTAALRASEEQLRLLIDNSLQGILLYQDGRILFANRAIEGMVGYKLDQMLAATETDLVATIHPDDYPTLAQGLTALWTGEVEQLTEQFRLRHPDGSFHWVICMFVLVEHALRPAAQAAMVDITDLKRAEQERLESQRFVERITETAPILTYVYDVREGRDIYINQSARAFLGYTIEDFDRMGPNFLATIIHPEDLPRVQSKIARYPQLRDGEIFEQEVRIRRKDGDWRWFLTRDSVSQWGEDRRPLQVVGVNMDITEIKQSELAMQEAESALRTALARERELGELKSRFVAMASHEFRTPLASIYAYAETLLTYRNRLGEEKVNDRLNRICRQVDHLSQMIEEVLSLTSAQGGKVVPKLEMLDFDQFCRQVVAEQAARPDIRHEFHYACTGAPLAVYGDPKLLRTVLTNLLSNAVKYSPAGSSVCVAAGRRDDRITLAVADSGIGIPERDQQRLFEAFHRASNVGNLPGTGLGLSIAREFLQLMDGSIRFDSQAGAGTTFEIELPDADCVDPAMRPHSPAVMAADSVQVSTR